MEFYRPLEEVGATVKEWTNGLGLDMLGVVFTADGAGQQKLKTLEELLGCALLGIGRRLGISERRNMDCHPENRSPYCRRKSHFSTCSLRLNDAQQAQLSMFKNTIYIPGAKRGNNTNSLCSNCGKNGHSFRQCNEPVLSYGIIVMRFTNPEWTLEKTLCNGLATLNGTEGAGEAQILMVQRKDSLRFVEFVRGKYLLKDQEYIKQLLSNMTEVERALIRESTFPQLWNHVWGTPNPRSYRSDFEQSQEKFNQLKRDSLLEKLLDETTPLYATPEWGFPKGRRNLYESDVDCAVRECAEETDLQRHQLMLFDGIEPLCETFYGDNKVFYSHKYYIAMVAPGTEVAINPLNPHMSREIGAIEWLKLEDALSRIRPENLEKRELLLRAFSIFKNLCPFRNARNMTRYFSATSSE